MKKETKQPDWRKRWNNTPVTKDDYAEWLHPAGLQFFLHQDKKDKLWYVVNIELDLAWDKGYKSKKACINNFYKKFSIQGLWTDKEKQREEWASL
tara:strand:- start:3356 stop:3640 length:285 start_codon:yes stop_codon:yes gene_type:complete